MNAPVLPSHRRVALASSQRGTVLARRMLARPMLAQRRVLLRIALGVALGSCTLTRDDFAPVLTEAEPIQPALEPPDEPGADAGAPASESCTAALDCPEGFECVDAVCRPRECDSAEDVGACVVDVCLGDGCTSGCSDGVQGDGETGVDCGGPCAPCSAMPGCAGDAECGGGTCVEGRCAEPSCDDGKKNQDESGPDCGGATCGRCSAGVACGADVDCADGLFCAPATSACAPVSCQDGARNGAERGIDCGGGSCPGCEAGAACELPGDCASEVAECCQAPACNDGVKNGNETAADCGAAPCGRCDVGSPCTQPGQCASNVCAANVCTEFCGDGVPSGDESATDCGGSEAGCPRCADGLPCGVDADCASGSCDGGVCVSCTDGFENGDEGGVDCGGSEPGCPACPRCNADNSIDLGGIGFISTIDGDACARITEFPGYAPSVVDSYDEGTFPVPFSYRQECSGVTGSGQFDVAFDRVAIPGLSVACPVIFDFGASAPFELRWF
jgi:hypothetical protein